MPDNRRRNANSVPIVKFLTIAVIGISACVAGLGFVWCKNDMYATGTQIKKLEGELVQLRSRNEAARTNIAKLISTAELQKRYASGWIKLIPISGDRIVKTFFKTHATEFIDRPEWPEARRNPDFIFKAVTRKPVIASEAEQRANPRARSAKLRVVERISDAR